MGEGVIYIIYHRGGGVAYIIYHRGGGGGNIYIYRRGRGEYFVCLAYQVTFWP